MNSPMFGFMAWLTAVSGCYLALLALEMNGNPSVQAYIVMAFAVVFLAGGGVLMGRRQVRRQQQEEKA
jgi:hypothetical protein